MTTENVVETTTVTVPSKVALLKSKITREGLILGGIVTGIIIAGGLAIVRSGALEDDSVTIETNDDGSFTVSDNTSDALPES